MACPDDEESTTLSGLVNSAEGGGGKFGSAHPNAVNFLLGDDAVRSLFLTTPAKIMAALETVNDGTTVSGTEL